MDEKEKLILETFKKVVPNLSEIEKEKLISFGEGIVFKSELLKKEEPQKSSRKERTQW